MTQTQTARDWELPTVSPEIDGNSPGRSSADLDEWKALVRKVFDIATQKNWTKSDVARRIDMAMGTFSQWYSGKYTGRLDTNNAKVQKWLSSMEEMAGLALTVPKGPDFVLTPTAREIIGALQFAQLMPDFVTVTAAAGTGKTAACLQYALTRPNVWMVTASPHTKTVHGMLVELATELDIIQHNPARLVRAIGSRLKKTGGGTLLIVDEAQNLVDDAINQLRHFVDNYQCGLALVGNDEIYMDVPLGLKSRHEIIRKRIDNLLAEGRSHDVIAREVGVSRLTVLRRSKEKPPDRGQMDLFGH